METEIVSNSQATSRKSREFDWRLVIPIILLLALAGVFVYFWKMKAEEIGDLHLSIVTLQSEKEKLEKELYETQSKAEQFRTALNNTQAACRSVSSCNEEQARILRRSVLGDAGLVDVISQSKSEGLFYYAYLFEKPEQAVVFLPQKLKDFMNSNCSATMKDVTTTASNRYDYALADGRVASVVMDGELRKITCAWVYDASADSYTPIKHQ